MATILLTWELGGGLGHMMGLRPLAEQLVRRGHHVVAILRDLSITHQVFADLGVEILQAPFKHERMRHIEPTCTFAQVLYTVGFGEAGELATLAQAWRQMFEWLKPDLIVLDHSPTALLAARGLPARRALIGQGFAFPPDVARLPNLRTWLRPDPAPLQACEDRVLSNINNVLRSWGQAPLERVTQLYHPVDANFLLTFPELDVYPRPQGTRYWGALPPGGIGPPPEWPPGRGPRIFAYLKPFPALPQLLEAISGLPNPSLIFADGLSGQARERLSRPNVKFAAGAVDMPQTAAQCDLAILNGTHATTAAMLLAGKPVLQIPIFLEQALNAIASVKLGAAISALPTKPEQVVGGLQAMLADGKFAAAAQAFAARHAEHDAVGQLEQLIDRAVELATHEGKPAHFAHRGSQV